MRITGMASGMDINQIVDDMMRVRRMPIDNMIKQRQVLEWQMEDFRNINRQLNTFRNKIVDTLLITRQNLEAKAVTSSNTSLVSATASSSANNTTFTISKVDQLARAASIHSAGGISKVVGPEEGEAEGTVLKIDRTQAIGDQQFAGDFTWEKGIIEQESFVGDGVKSTFTFAEGIATEDFAKDGEPPEILRDPIVKVNGRAYNVVTGTGDLNENEVRVHFNEEGGSTLEFAEPIAKNASVSVSYFLKDKTETFGGADNESKVFNLSRGSIAQNEELKISGDGEYEIYFNKEDFESHSAEDKKAVYVNAATGRIEFKEAPTTPVSVTYTQNYTTSSITTFNADGEEVKDTFIIRSGQSLNQVMEEINRSNVGVSIFYDEFADKVSVQRKEAGVFNKNGDEMKFDGEFFQGTLKLNVVEDEDGKTNLIEAQNAKFTINGMDTERRTNSFTIDGVTITLKETFKDSPVSLNVATDTDKVFETIKGFVDDYNEMLEEINGKLTEERHRDYKPLTDEERDALSDKEVERWEERARSGLLRNDSMIMNIMDGLRREIYNPVSSDLNSEYKQLSAIGITTSKDYMERGKLEINEAALREAIESDPEGVAAIFAADGPTKESQGIVRRLRDSIDQGIGVLAERAGGFKGLIQNHQFTLGRNINDINDRISNFERRLQQYEDRLWRQFTAMEQAVNQSNQQAETLFSQLYGGMQ